MSKAEPVNGAGIPHPTDNPFLSAFLGLAPGEPFTVGPVPEETAIRDAMTGRLQTPQGPMNTLQSLRIMFPFIPIMPFPDIMRSVVLVANVAQELVIPDMCQVIILRGSTDYYVSHLGRAEVPVDATAMSLYRPDGIAFYVGGKKSLSVITPSATGCIVTILGYIPPELPQYDDRY